MKKLKQKSFCLMSVTLLLLVCGISAFSQEVTARISGQVTDAAGAVVEHERLDL